MSLRDPEESGSYVIGMIGLFGRSWSLDCYPPAVQESPYALGQGSNPLHVITIWTNFTKTKVARGGFSAEPIGSDTEGIHLGRPSNHRWNSANGACRETEEIVLYCVSNVCYSLLYKPILRWEVTFATSILAKPRNTANLLDGGRRFRIPSWVQALSCPMR